MSNKPKVRIIRVTQTVDYLLEEYVENAASILKEWFQDPRYPLDHRHAYRDGSRIGNSTRFVSCRELTSEELEEEADKRGKNHTHQG